MLNEEIPSAYPELAPSGFKVKRGALYLRLMPIRVNTIEEETHVRCLPVKARKPQFNALKAVPELRFTRAQYRMKDEITACIRLPIHYLLIAINKIFEEMSPSTNYSLIL